MAIDFTRNIEYLEIPVKENYVYYDIVKPRIIKVIMEYALQNNGPFYSLNQLWKQKDQPRFSKSDYFYDIIYRANVVNYFHKNLNFDIFAAGKKAVIDYPINNPTFNNLEGFLSMILGNANFKIELGPNINEVTFSLPMGFNTGYEDQWVDNENNNMVTNKGENIVFYRQGNELEKLKNILSLFMPLGIKAIFKDMES